MAATIRVSTRELRNRANKLEEYNEKFYTQVTGLKEDESVLTQTFEGDSQKQFHIAFTNNAEKFDQFHAVIQKYIQQLREDADAYDRTEAENVSIASTK